MRASRGRVGIVGASGYTGAVLARLVAAHPRMTLAFCTSDKRAGEPIAAALDLPVGAWRTRDASGDAPDTGGADDGATTRIAPNDAAERLADGCDAVVLAASAEVAASLAPRLLRAGRTVVDLSGGFRLRDAAAYGRWYRFDHPAPTLLATAHYGLPELFGAPRAGDLVANPGCYPTATLLALAPLVRAGLVDDAPFIDGKSGVTGAGRQAKERYSFAELDESVHAYKVLSHQHTPEIAQQLAVAAGRAIRPTFTAHLLPVRRGLIVTCYARPRGGATPETLRACLEAAYEGSRFVRVVDVEEVTLAGVVGTNRALVGVTSDDHAVVVVAAIDNLLKGAGGQALQNLNLAFGFDEAAGLDHLSRSAA